MCALVREVRAVRPIIGLEVHVELATRTKLFSSTPNPAAPPRAPGAGGDGPSAGEAPPNTLIDPVTLGLPGALPVLNKAAVELAMRAGLALRCQVATLTKWDRKSYFYPDLPKAYQISQYDLPICFDGAFDLPPPTEDAHALPDLGRAPKRIGIQRAHLEEDAGKLLHELPGGGALDGSIVDWNRAGTPLLEIVTRPDFTSAADVVLFARLLRQLLRALRVTRGVMQAGHLRFEPNINCELVLDDGSTVRTPITEVKNLNSFRAVEGAIDYELREQPRRWLHDGRTFGPGTKTTRGWDDARGVTFVQREKEDAHDYRYFADPDLPALTIDEAWRGRVEATLPTPPLERYATLMRDAQLAPKEAFALVEEPGVSDLCFEAIEQAVALGLERPRATKGVANVLLGPVQALAHRAGVLGDGLGFSPRQLAEVAQLRDAGDLSNASTEPLLVALREQPHASPRELGTSLRLLVVRDAAALARFVAEAIAAQPQAAADVRAGKQQALGRLIGEATKLAKAAGQPADAKDVRAALLEALGG